MDLYHDYKSISEQIKKYKENLEKNQQFNNADEKKKLEKTIKDLKKEMKQKIPHSQNQSIPF